MISKEGLENALEKLANAAHIMGQDRVQLLKGQAKPASLSGSGTSMLSMIQFLSSSPFAEGSKGSAMAMPAAFGDMFSAPDGQFGTTSKFDGKERVHVQYSKESEHTHDTFHM